MSLEITDVILEFLATVVRFYAVRHFVYIFLAKDECCWKHIWVLYVFAICWTSLIYMTFKSPILNIISNLAGYLMIVLPYKVRFSRKLLLVSMIYVVGMMVDSIVVLSFTNYAVGELINPVYECVISLILLFLAILLERTIAVQQDICLSLFYRIASCLVPIVSIGCIYYMVLTVIEAQRTVTVVASALLVINLLDFYLYHSLVRFYSDRMEKKLLEQMVEVYAYQLDAVRASQEKVAALRHDMKHHLIELSAMVNEKENPEMIKYLQDMEQFMLNPKERVATGNQEIDGVLNYLFQRADERLAHTEIKISIPEKLCRADFNICVILGNLVDNAIREAEKSQEKYLRIDIRSKQGILLIFVENSYSGKIVRSGNAFRTTQTDSAIHGLGLKNVKKIVQADGGEMHIDYDDNRFKVQVLLYSANFK